MRKLDAPVSCWAAGVRTFSLSMVAALKPHGIQLSTLWIWEFDNQNSTGYAVWPGVDDVLITALQRHNL
jgi:hypothetical protein